MADFFNNTNSASVTAAGSSVVMPPSAFSGKTPEVILQEKITAAIESGHMVVSLPWGGNPRPKKDGNPSKHLLMTQKGPIGYGQYGVFADVRAEGILLWLPEADATGRPTRGSWLYPTSHRQGEDGDEPVPGAKLGGLHRVMANHWKRRMQSIAAEFTELAEDAALEGDVKESKALKEKAADALATAQGFSIDQVFGKKFNFNLPMLSVAELQAMKQQGIAQAQAKLGGAKTDKATMVYNLILSVDIQYSEDGEFSISVHDVLEQYAPLMTIPNGSKNTLSQLEIMQALMLGEGETISKADKVAALDTEMKVLSSKQGKNADKKEARKAIRLMAAELELEVGALEEYIKDKAGRMGLAWGVANLKPTKAEVIAWANGGNASTTAPNESVQAGAKSEVEGEASETKEEQEVVPQGSLLPNHQTEAALPDAADIDVEV